MKDPKSAAFMDEKTINEIDKIKAEIQNEEAL